MIKNQFAQFLTILTIINIVLFSTASYAAEYGPVAVKETLWSIASRHRPSNAVTTQQVMLAIRRANPDAFQANNINALKAGAILRLPSINEIRLMGTSQALIAAKIENSAWHSKQQTVQTQTSTTPKLTTATVSTSYKQHYQASQRELAKLQKQLKREKQRVKVLKADIKVLKFSETQTVLPSSSTVNTRQLNQKITDLEQLIEAKNVHIGQLENMKVVAAETIKRQLANNEMLFNKLKILDPQAVIDTRATTGSLELKALDDSTTSVNPAEIVSNASLSTENSNNFNLVTWLILVVLIVISLFIAYVLWNMYIQYRLGRKMRSQINPNDEQQDTNQTVNNIVSDRKTPQLGT